MIFLGDIAIPEGIDIVIENLDLFHGKNVIANLEGLITSTDNVSIEDNKLFSNKIVVKILKELNVNVVSLANNHVTDVPDAWEETQDILKNKALSILAQEFL